MSRALSARLTLKNAAEEVVDHNGVIVHVGPEERDVGHGDRLALVLLGPSEDVLDLRHAADEVAANEFAPPVPVGLAVPLVVLLLAEFRFEDLRAEVQLRRAIG